MAATRTVVVYGSVREKRQEIRATRTITEALREVYDLGGLADGLTEGTRRR